MVVGRPVASATTSPAGIVRPCTPRPGWTGERSATCSFSWASAGLPALAVQQRHEAVLALVLGAHLDEVAAEVVEASGSPATRTSSLVRLDRRSPRPPACRYGDAGVRVEHALPAGAPAATGPATSTTSPRMAGGSSKLRNAGVTAYCQTRAAAWHRSPGPGHAPERPAGRSECGGILTVVRSTRHPPGGFRADLRVHLPGLWIRHRGPRVHQRQAGWPVAALRRVCRDRPAAGAATGGAARPPAGRRGRRLLRCRRMRVRCGLTPPADAGAVQPDGAGEAGDRACAARPVTPGRLAGWAGEA